MTEKKVFYKEDFTHKKASEALLSGDMEEWDNFRDCISIQNGKTYKVLQTNDLQDIDLSGRNFDGYNFSRQNLERVNLSNSSFKKADFQVAYLQRTNLTGTNLEFSNLEGCDLTGATFKNTNMSNISKMGNIRIQAQTITFYNVDFRNTNLSEQDLSGCRFIRCDLRGTNFQYTQLMNTSWSESIISKDTCIELANFEDHSVTRDSSQKIKCNSWVSNTYLTKYAFNWGAIRFIGAIPLFEFSWVLLIGLLFLVNSIAFLNRTTPKCDWTVRMAKRVIG